MYNDFWDAEKWVSQATNEQIGAWVKLLSLASQGTEKGVVCITPNLPYSGEQLETLLGLTNSKLQDLLVFLKCKGAINVKSGIVHINNWKTYQSEYDRLKKYKTGTKKGTAKGTAKGNAVEVEVDVEVEVNKEKKTTKDSAPVGAAKFNALKYFIDEYLLNLKTPYANADPGKDGKLLKQIVADNGVEKYKLALSRHWKKTDRYTEDRKHDVVSFKTNISPLLSEKADMPIITNGLPSADEVDA